MNLSTPLTDYPRAKRYLPKLEKLGIRTVRDLLYHLPTRYDDFSRVRPVATLVPGEPCTVRGTVASITARRAWRNQRMVIVDALLSDKTGSVRVIWFNQPYLVNTLKPGTEVSVAGNPSAKTGALLFLNPAYETAAVSPSHTARIIPVYPQTKGLTSRGIRYLVKPLLEETYEDPLPNTIREEAHLPDINEALQSAHFPANGKEAEWARHRFVFEELFIFQLYQNLRRRRFLNLSAHPVPKDDAYLDQFIRALPFGLTASQQQVRKEVERDMEREHPMHRLLQGDVGSGKTVIASLAALLAARAGFQSALMAPTEVLAVQHFKTVMDLFPGFEGSIALLTSSQVRLWYGEGLVREIKRRELAERIADGSIPVVIGTHALIQKYVSFGRLALVVIDEQHRFGVEQRAALLRRSSSGGKSASGEQYRTPHLLSMTATPIPRSLALTIWSDLDVSYLTELPKGRKRILTYVVPPAKRAGAYEFIRKEVREGRQVFVICPRIEKADDAGTDVKTVTEEYETLSKQVFPDLRVALLHGKLKSKEKNGVMKAFAEGETDILVATSVVEVGVDVPNATIMLIEGSEHFGLAQLYQLRGRVGRGEHQSYCLLFTDSSVPSTVKRLELVAKARSGLELAEQDLRLRGPGEFFGTTQTGMPDLAMKAVRNPAIVKQAGFFAAKLLDEDPKLEQYPLLRANIKHLIAEIREA